MAGYPPVTYTQFNCPTCGIVYRATATLPAPMDVADKLSHLIGVDSGAVMDLSAGGSIMAAVLPHHANPCSPEPT